MTSSAPPDTREQFRRCETCSRTFGFLLDREFGHVSDAHERALTKLAGGILNKGYQCGMLWGACMGVGAEAARRCDDPSEAVGLALAASRAVVDSFEGRTQTIDCRDVTGKNLDTFLGMMAMMFEVFTKGMMNSPCFVLADAWAPEAIAAAREGLDAHPEHELPPASCASEVVHAMGGTPEEAVMVAGFGGGMGLRGGGCGALAAAIWMKGVQWSRAPPDDVQSYGTKTGDKAVLKAFLRATEGSYECHEICGRRFGSIDEHSRYVAEGGCRSLIEAVASA